VKTTSVAGGFCPGGSAASSLGEKVKLLLHQFQLVMGLIFHIAFDRRLVNADRGDKVSSVPKRTPRELAGLLLDPGRGLSLQYSDRVRYGIFWRNGEVDVDVVISDVPRFNRESFPRRNGLEYSL
jgi:hypothetical protein